VQPLSLRGESRVAEFEWKNEKYQEARMTICPAMTGCAQKLSCLLARKCTKLINNKYMIPGMCHTVYSYKMPYRVNAYFTVNKLGRIMRLQNLLIIADFWRFQEVSAPNTAFQRASSAII